MRCFLLLPALLTAAAVPASATSLVVPDVFPTIASALGAATAGDTVLVRAGTYPERVTLVDGVVLRGDIGPERPILDGGGAGPVVTATSLGSSTRVERLVLRNGSGAAFGGGASLNHSDVVFSACLFTGNTATNGAGLGADGGNFRVTGCRFESNVAAQSGGAIAVTGVASPTIEASMIFGNSAVAGGAVAVLNGATPDIDSCLVDSNHASQGGAVWWDFLTGGTLESCTIVESSTTAAGAGALHTSVFATPMITACIVALSTQGAAMSAAAGITATLGCNDLFGNAGGNSIAGVDLGTNISLDALFCDAADHGWTLRDTSPCLAGGSCPQRGAYGVGCATVAAPPTMTALNWGSLKSLWRR